MMSSADRPRVERLVEVGLEAVALAVDDPPLQPLGQRQRSELGGPGGLGVAASTPSNSSSNRWSGS